MGLAMVAVAGTRLVKVAGGYWTAEAPARWRLGPEGRRRRANHEIRSRSRFTVSCLKDTWKHATMQQGGHQTLVP